MSFPGLTEMAEAYRILLFARTGTLTNGTTDTPLRAAKALADLTDGYDVDIAGLFTTFESEGYDEMIAASDISFSSLCEHHMLPFMGKAHVVYVPGERIVGLSKIPRLVEAFSRRFQNQERITKQIADAMEQYLKPQGVLVQLEAEHTCASLRGVRKHTTMRTSVTRGLMRDDPKARDEALRLIGR